MADIVALGEPLDRVQPGALGGSVRVPAGVRRRHVEHGDRRRAPRRARRLRDEARRRRASAACSSTCGRGEGVDASGVDDRPGSADRRLLRHARTAGARVLIPACRQRGEPHAPGHTAAAALRGPRGSLHASGISQAISASACDAVFAAFDVARASGAIVSYDPNVRLKLWPLARARADRASRRWRMCTWCLPSQDDATVLFEDLAPDAVVDAMHRAGAQRRRAEAGRRRMPRLRRHATRAHRRARGARASTRPAPAIASTVRSRPDCMAGDDPFAAARYANVAAALATTGYGAVAPLPRAADVDRVHAVAPCRTGRSGV